MSAPEFQVVRGNPSDDEVAALSAVLAQITAEAQSDARGDRNLWGQHQSRRREHVYNPNAFRNVSYF
ncbi:acyl-CoA carboxylase subunit epsilon [Corynebacterium tapiri]|uniref:Acyl-CoA carboxylase subunit epsilon n=1 Tax=Corynebacterium tapiri TaxID=1448266 RepID=A0A5C4U435_9CORY|nr:acyl-CoA carboxylase subunit epsilon [Corynebacterium tapiri]TNL98442.1 acyl-CoA carboxylase subunit epsilon [Corynebacterium tapiri]